MNTENEGCPLNNLDGISILVDQQYCQCKEFNYFNFNHWHILCRDILRWFGGSAEIPVLVPTKT
jgi:hypothetical protein